MQNISQDNLNGNSNKSVQVPGAESALASAGAHFVLCTPDKKPIWNGWPRRRPTAEAAAIHRREDGLLGIIPWSLRSTGLDVDAGDPEQLFSAFVPLVEFASKRRGGRHAYYDDTEPRGNSKWAAFGCSGEVRGSKGYLILHNNGLELLAEVLERRVEGARAWPRDLFEMAGLPPVEAREPMPFAEVREPELERSPLIKLPLERTKVGGRGNALFDQVRLWAYQQSKGPSLIDWKRAGASLCAPTKRAFLYSLRALSGGRGRGCLDGLVDFVVDVVRRRGLGSWLRGAIAARPCVGESETVSDGRSGPLNGGAPGCRRETD